MKHHGWARPAQLLTAIRDEASRNLHLEPLALVTLLDSKVTGPRIEDPVAYINQYAQEVQLSNETVRRFSATE